jgi:MoxR-like ATPase
MNHRSSVHDLKSLVLSFHSIIAIETVEEERARAIVGEVAADLQLPLYEWSVTTGIRRVHGHYVAGTEEPAAMLRHLEELNCEAVFLLKDLGPHLVNASVARALRELGQRLARSRSTLILTGDPLVLPRELDALAVQFALELPSGQELRDTMRQVVDAMKDRQVVHVDLSRDDVQHLVQALSGLTLNQARRVIAQAIVEDGQLNAADVEAIIRRKGEIIERDGVLEFFPVEENQRYELGGFTRLKDWLARARIGFSAEARALNLEAPKGVLLVGVQGCGKSLAAKFIAREWQMPLLKLDAGRLYDKFVGESEKNFRKAVAMAEAMAPVVLWIDEIEKAFPSGVASDADGGLSQRLFGSFLTWLQEKDEGVFVVGAANDLTRTAPELLRKGRFDEIFFVDLPRAEEREQIFAIHLGLRKQDATQFDLPRLAEAAEGFSGAEIEQAVISALYRALHRKEPLTTAAVLGALQSTVPLSVARAEDVHRIRAMATGRFMPV